jgi:hypothetical protein
VNIRVDHEALLRGYAKGDELSVIDGIGEVPVPAIESLLPTSFLKVLFYEAEELIRISHPGRTLTEKLKTALLNEYPTCVVPGVRHEAPCIRVGCNDPPPSCRSSPVKQRAA